MAVKKTVVAQDRKEADGFLNLSVVDKNGVTHKVTAVIPLYLENRVHAAMLRKGGEFVLTGSVHIVDKNPAEIQL